MSIYCPYTNGNVVYLKCQECEDKTCEKGWFFCGVGGTPLSMMKCRKQMSEYLDKMLAKRDKVVIAAESGKRWLLWQLCMPANADIRSYLLETMICPHTYRSSSKKAV